MARTALSFGSNRVQHFVDGTRQTQSSAESYRALPPAIPPPELILGEGGRYRAVVVIADPTRYPADGFIRPPDGDTEAARSLTVLFDARIDVRRHTGTGGTARQRYSMGFVRKVRTRAGDPMCLAAVRVFGEIVSVLQRRLEIAMQHVNDHVGGTAPIVVYLMPGDRNDPSGFGDALLPQVQMLADTFGHERELAVIVAPWPGLCGAEPLPVALDRTGVFTPNSPVFDGLRPGQRLVTVLTGRRLRPGWQVCVPRERGEQHRYLEVPRELVADRRFGRGYGRRVTDATVRRLGLMQRIGALASPAVVYSDDESDALATQKRSVAILCQEAQRVVQMEQRALAGRVGDKVRALLAAFRSNAPGEAVVPADYALLLRAQTDGARMRDALVRNLGQQSEPALALMDVQHAGEDLWRKLDRVMEDVFPDQLWRLIHAQIMDVVAFTQPAIDAFRGEWLGLPARLRRARTPQEAAATGNRIANDIMGRLVGALDQVLQLIGVDGKSITCSPAAGQELNDIAARIGELRAQLGEPAVVFADIPAEINRQAATTRAGFEALRERCLRLQVAVGRAHENPDDPGWVPPGDAMEPVRYFLKMYGHDVPQTPRDCPFWFQCAWMALNVAVVLVRDVSNMAFANCDEVKKVKRELLAMFGKIDERIKTGAVQARNQARVILAEAEAEALTAPVSVSEQCLQRAVTIREFFDRATLARQQGRRGAWTWAENRHGPRNSLAGLRIGIDSKGAWAKGAANAKAVLTAVARGNEAAGVLFRRATDVVSRVNRDRAANPTAPRTTRLTTALRWDRVRYLVLDGFAKPGWELGGSRPEWWAPADEPRDLVGVVATSTNFFGPPSTQSSAADASFNAIVLIASVRELHEWAAVFERELLELFAERCAMVAAFHDALLLTATASREAGRLGAPTGAAVRRQWWLPLFGKVSFFTRRSPRRPTWFGRLNPFTWFSFAFDAGLPELPALRLSGAWRGFYRVNLWGVVGGLWDWATDRQLPTRPRFPRPSLPGMGYVRSVARWFGGLRLPGWLRWWSRHRADESLPQPRPGRGGWWDVRRFLGRLPRFGFPRWRLRGPGFDGPDLDAALRSLGSVRRRRPRWSFSLWWSTQHRPVSDYDASLLDLDEFALLSEQYGTLGASIRGGTTATRHGRHKRPRAKGHSAYTSAEYQQRDIIVPLSALRLVVGPVLDGSPITPGLFGPPVFPLVADLGRFERVVVLPGPVPTLSSVPGGDAVAWLEGCVARGGDVRLCFGQPGPRTYRPVALGGRAIVEPIAADHDVRSGEVPYEPGTILVVRGATASVMASRARTSDDDMLVVTASSIGWATPKTGRKVRGLGVVAALAQ